ncbi:PAS domain S-box [Rivularia sp. PCC 7116]|uniref:PAS domain S-box protein n=1 Tax=Rivularia sp. PCC 7116 TaxID=373994 RepID=UPI00029F0A21|nr:PAS domain S-box protein [Rivularia sp. PCC 7116]AFY56504.1 PAS domain S-box [Rivularia sp. PCC 7116]
MQSNAEPIDLPPLTRFINTSPAIVTPETLVIDAIALMRIPVQNINQNLNAPNISQITVTANNQQTDCVLVCENLLLQGILTTSDIIRFILSRNNLNKVKVAEVMTRQVVTLKKSQSNNIFTALQLMRQHRIGNLPIVNDFEQIVGIITQDSLLQNFDLQALLQRQTQTYNCYESHKQVNFETHVLNRLGDAVVGIDNEHCIIYLNQAAEKLYNVKLENFVGKRLEEAYDSRWVNSEDEQAARDALSATEAWQGENIHIKNNGEEIFVESSVNVLKDNSGENIGLIAVIRDITKRKRAEIAIREKLQQLETIVNNNPIGIYRFIYHTDGKVSIPYASVGYRQLLGLNPTDMSAYPEDVLATIHLDDREKFAQALITATGEQHQSHYMEYRAIDVLGQVKWLGNNFRCSNHTNGDLIVDGVDIDITPRKRAEISLQTSEERFRSLVEISSDWVWEVNEYGFFTYASPKVLDILGYTPQEILGKTPLDLLPTEEGKRLVEVLNSFIIEKQQFKNLENIKFHKNGNSVIMETSGVPIFDANGYFRGYRGIDRDITERFQAEDRLRTSEERFRVLVTHAPVGIFQTNAKGECLFVNPRWSEITGLSEQEASGEGWSKALHSDDKEQVFTAWYDAATAGQEFAMEYRFCTPEGKVSWVFGNAIAICNQTGDITGYLGTVTDITEHKQAEEKLRWTQALLQEAQRIAKMGSWSRDLTTNERWWSEQYYRIINLNPGDAMPDVETVINSNVHPDDRDKIYQMVMACIEQGIPYETEVRFLNADNSIGYVFICGRVERDSQGNLCRYYGIVQDISEYKQVELELRESKERYRSVVKSMHEGVVIQQADGTIISCNASAQKILGLSAEQIKGRNSVDPRWRTIHEDGSPFPGETHPAMVALHTGKPCLYTVMGVYKPNGKLTWILINSEPLFLPGQNLPYRVVTSFSDITRRKEAEEKIKEQAQLLDITTDAILVKDLEETILYCNNSAENIYGWKKEELIGKTANEILYEEISPELESALSEVVEAGSWQGELHKITKTGKNIIVASRWTLVRDKTGKPESVLTVDTDITQTKHLENQFLRTQRLESLGTLASGIAHDLNNMLTPILAIAQLLPFKLNNEEQDCREMLSMLEDSAKRGADLVKQILTFARGNEGKRTVLQIKHLLKEIEQFANRTFTKSIAINRYLPQDLLTISADPTQMHQVFMNLVVNARDAMPNGGTITISAQNLYIDESYAKMNIEAKVGNYVVVTIADTGKGISPEAIERVFDPFFTTKEVGKGTGLGLSTAIGIIKNHGGFIEVTSELGKGSQFKVYLPSTQDKRIEPAQENIALLGNSEQILIVDDEPAICEIVKTTLESQNFDILTAADGIEAISTYVQNKTGISIVLIDMMMPEMDGATAIATLQQLNPQVKIIAMSGLTSTQTLAQAAGTGIQGFLAKPFTQYDLLNTISGVLSASSN